jgi:hypothetical protein
MGDCYAAGLEPTSAEMNRFYAECGEKGLGGLIQLYDDSRNYFFLTEKGTIVERPSGEEYDTFRARGGYRVDLYLYRDDQLTPQPLTLDHFIPPSWFRGFLLKQLERGFSKNIDKLIEELETAEVELKDHDHWFGRIEEFLEMFVCSSKQAKAYIDKVRALMEGTEEFQHLGQTHS